MTTVDRIVVAGAGLAGLRAAERLRELGFTGELVIVGAERHRPYHRPALSKQLLSGELRGNDLALRSYVDLDARWRLGVPVCGLDVRRRVVALPGDEEIRYDGLVIATGVEPRHLAGAPRHDSRVHVLRTLRDGIAIRRTLAASAEPIAIIGGGFTACEIASTMRELGRDVVIVARQHTLLGHLFGPHMSHRITALHRSHGVKVATGATVQHWIPDEYGLGLHLSTGKLVLAGSVIVSVGGVPAVHWLRGSGLTLEDGVLCDPTCHVVGATDVVAAGDVARWPNLRFGDSPQRVEHWLNAVEMGRAAAESLLAGRAAAHPFTPVPRFWSEQHGVRIQGAGALTLADDTVLLGGKENGRGVRGYLRRGRLVGVVALDSPQEMLHWTAQLARKREPVDRKPTPYPRSRPRISVVHPAPSARIPTRNWTVPSRWGAN